jgi:uncharacterized tellurite resistance protein B-like protein
MYADILIALVRADDEVDEREEALLNGILENMGLDGGTIQKLWMTPRTMDVIESMLEDVEDEHFRRCLIKDCFLLAYADEAVDPSESRFIKRVAAAMNVDRATLADIREWVATAVEQKRRAVDLFGEEDA